MAFFSDLYDDLVSRTSNLTYAEKARELYLGARDTRDNDEKLMKALRLIDNIEQWQNEARKKGDYDQLSKLDKIYSDTYKLIVMCTK